MRYQSGRNMIFSVILFMMCAWVGICESGGSALAEQVKKRDAGKTNYKVVKEDGLYYMVNENGTYQSGWFLKVGKKYAPLGTVENLGLYKPEQIHLLYAYSDGMLAQEKERGDYRYDEKGYLYHTSGLYRMKKKYYFLKKGRLQTTDGSYKKQSYYVRVDGSVYGYKIKNRIYTPSGNRMDSLQKRDFECRNYANKILRSIVKKNMTKSQGLQASFQYIVHHYNYADMHCDGRKGWTSKLGEEILKRQRGDCRGIAMGFVYLADELGYVENYLCQDTKDRYSGSHCWAMVNGKCYDPLFYNSRRPTRYQPVFNGSSPAAYLQKVHCSAQRKFKAGE